MTRLLPSVLVSGALLGFVTVGAVIGALLPPAFEDTLSKAAAFADVLRGLSTSLVIAGIATVGGLLLGVAWSGLALVLPRRLAAGMHRIVAILGAAPTPLFVAILMVSVREARPSLPIVLGEALDARWLLAGCIALLEGLAWVPAIQGRLAALRGSLFTLRVRAPRAPVATLLLRSIGPDAVRALALFVVLALPSALAAEGFLSFLGFGVEAPHVSLGTLIGTGARVMSVAPWALLFPSLALLGVTISLRVLGAALQERVRGARYSPFFRERRARRSQRPQL